MNIEKIIKNNKIEKEYQIVKEMEDMIQNIYKTNVDTDILDDEKLLLYRINDNNNFNIKFYKTPKELLETIVLPNFLQEIYSDLIFYGSFVRLALIDSDTTVTNKELFIATYKVIENVDEEFLLNGFEKSETGYYKKMDFGVIHFIINRFKSSGEILLYNPYLTRIGIHRDEFIVSAMFLIEYNRNLKHMNTKKSDPKFSTEIDLFHLNKKLEKKDLTIFDLINKKEYEVFDNIMTYNFDLLNNGLTPIEYALKLYVAEECEIILHQLRLIIYELYSNIKFLRLPGFYADIINLKEKDESMYDIFTTNDYKTIYNTININTKTTIYELNYQLLSYYVSQDDSETFYRYLKLYVKKIDTKLIQLLYEKNPKKIITEGINKKYFNLNNIYKIILFSQDLDYFDLIDFDLNIACNYVEDCISRCLLRSFYFLFKKEKNIILFQDSNENNVLHNISERNSYQEMIKLLITLNPEILNMKNVNGDTPIISHIKNKNYSIVETIIKNYSCSDLYEHYDSNNNTILHLLCGDNKNISLIKLFIYDNLSLINKVNKENETAILISTKTNSEDIFFLLKSLNADMTIIDDYGNSIYHYICMNSMVLGSVIENKPNIFGYTPEDYCDISLRYYAFI
jgi:hypothetical protein